ncbi:MAG: hypothetical protein IPM20_10570 [Gammaproteobacteria bacterium]|nr:hypothetical protein [Gammaproteobacteria bacterium]
MVKRIGFLVLLICSIAVQADDEDVPINSGSELRDWCKAETEAHFVGTGETPYNWSASWWEEGATLIVKGSWRVRSAEVVVECRVPRHAMRKYAVYQILE